MCLNVYLIFLSLTTCSTFSHRFSGRHQRWNSLCFFYYIFSGGLLVFLRVVLCALLIHYLSSCFTYFNHRMNWAQTEVCIHDFAYNFKSSSSFSGSFRPLTYNSKNWRWNFLILIQHNVHNHTKKSGLPFLHFPSQGMC